MPGLLLLLISSPQYSQCDCLSGLFRRCNSRPHVLLHVTDELLNGLPQIGQGLVARSTAYQHSREQYWPLVPDFYDERLAAGLARQYRNGITGLSGPQPKSCAGCGKVFQPKFNRTTLLPCRHVSEQYSLLQYPLRLTGRSQPSTQ